MFPFIIFCTALLLDYFLGEPKHYHPLVGFGHYAKYIEKTLNKHHKILIMSVFIGFLSVFLSIIPFYLFINILLEQLLIIDRSGFLLAMIEAV
ncbi:MAG: cobalamin biosynthesis protein, partial [Proteobacteria bacterium]|nr:cobalamin biosynthesis protein [Pseudomonadota bacterium]